MTHRFRTITQRGTTTQRGYGATHQATRRTWEDQLARTGALPCTRCHRPVYPGTRWHLDHTTDRTGYLGVAHRTCNERAGAREGRRRQDPPPTTRLRW